MRSSVVCLCALFSCEVQSCELPRLITSYEYGVLFIAHSFLQSRLLRLTPHPRIRMSSVIHIHVTESHAALTMEAFERERHKRALRGILLQSQRFYRGRLLPQVGAWYRVAFGLVAVLAAATLSAWCALV